MPDLFDATRIKSLELKNRIVRSATHEGMSDENGFPQPALLKLYERLARGGAGLIVTGYARVSRDGNSNLLGMQAIDRDDHIPAYRELVERVHACGARIAMQIAHCGRQTTRQAAGARPMAPSAVKDHALLITPRPMTGPDIERIIDAFAQAARRVKAAGFDAVQLHAAHGYLLNQFLSPYTNRRTDQWGGSIENRMRIIREIYQRCRDLVGEDYPILIKINAYDTRKKGLRLEESVIMARMMSDMGFDGIEVSCGIFEDNFSTIRGDAPLDVIVDDWDIYQRKNAFYRWTMKHLGSRIIKPLPFSEAYNREAAKTIKAAVAVPVFLVGGLNNPPTMALAIEQGHADYISLSRALIADSGFPNKIAAGSTEPSRCIHCNLCMAYATRRPLRCYHGKRLNSAA